MVDPALDPAAGATSYDATIPRTRIARVVNVTSDPPATLSRGIGRIRVNRQA